MLTSKFFQLVLKSSLILLSLNGIALATEEEKIFTPDPNMTALYPVKATIINVEKTHTSSCPVCEDYIEITGVTLLFPLAGCVDYLATYSQLVENVGDTAIVYYSALAGADKNSPTTRCFVAPTATTTIMLMGHFNKEKIVLKSLQLEQIFSNDNNFPFDGLKLETK